MKWGRQDETEHSEGARTRPSRKPLRSHPLFTPVLTIWGGLLGGLVTLVLPADLVLTAAAQLGLGGLDEVSRYVLAALAALAVGAIMLVVGKTLAAVTTMRRVRPIDPASELGSSSLDAPVETMPFAVAEAQHEPVAKLAEASAPAAPIPQELDLAQFAALPGRNAVWVEEPVTAAAPTKADVDPEPEPATEQAPVMHPVAPRPARPSAIERLRAVPTSELSLVQLVERFAAALHEHQAAPADHAGLATRDAALADALKALAALSRESEAQIQSEPVRAAISRLQELRGAA